MGGRGRKKAAREDDERGAPDLHRQICNMAARARPPARRRATNRRIGSPWMTMWRLTSRALWRGGLPQLDSRHKRRPFKSGGRIDPSAAHPDPDPLIRCMHTYVIYFPLVKRHENRATTFQLGGLRKKARSHKSVLFQPLRPKVTSHGGSLNTRHAGGRPLLLILDN